MNYQFLNVEELDGILTITINRESSLNALNQEVISELGHVIMEVVPSKKLKGVILTGAGQKAFVAGADIKGILGLDSKNASQLARDGQIVFNAFENCKVPTIAAVNGFALGGGCELAMSCHLRVASENAKFGQPEVNLGIIPGYGGTQRLARYIGKPKAMELCLTGDLINAEEALRMGLINHVVPGDQLLAKCEEIIQKIATKAPFAVSKVIEMVNAYYDKERNGFEEEIAAFGEIAETKDFIEGATAFIEKRKPNFTGE
jgi:enoyl-CoA hydratase